MLFHSSLRKELSRSFGATLVVLVTIVMTIILIRTLGLASKGSVNPSEVFLVMAYTVIGYMPTILSLALFVAIVGTLLLLGRFDPAPHRVTTATDVPRFARPTLAIGILVVVTLSAMILEGAGADWSAIYMRKEFTVSPFTSGFAVAIGALTQALTRMVADNVDRLKRIVDNVMEVAPGQAPDPTAIDATTWVASICSDWARSTGVKLGDRARCAWNCRRSRWAWPSTPSTCGACSSTCWTTRIVTPAACPAAWCCGSTRATRRACS